MHVVRCDFKPSGDYVGSGFCSAAFRSNSMLTMLRGQLEACGWTVVPGSRTRETEHFCPEHRPMPTVTVTAPDTWSHDPTE